MFFEMRFALGTLDSGEPSLPFGLLVKNTKYITAFLYMYRQKFCTVHIYVVVFKIVSQCHCQPFSLIVSFCKVAVPIVKGVGS